MKTKPFLYSLLFFAMLNPHMTFAQCSTMCAGTVGLGKNCTVMANIACTAYARTLSSDATTLTYSNANCSAMGNSGVAAHLPAMPTPASCSFEFVKVCLTTVQSLVTDMATISCQVDVADGLPVELMEFNIDS